MIITRPKHRQRWKNVTFCASLIFSITNLINKALNLIFHVFPQFIFSTFSYYEIISLYLHDLTFLSLPVVRLPLNFIFFSFYWFTLIFLAFMNETSFIIFLVFFRLTQRKHLWLDFLRDTHSSFFYIFIEHNFLFRIVAWWINYAE
jgi:hypothetical protein